MALMQGYQCPPRLVLQAQFELGIPKTPPVPEATGLRRLWRRQGRDVGVFYDRRSLGGCRYGRGLSTAYSFGLGGRLRRYTHGTWKVQGLGMHRNEECHHRREHGGTCEDAYRTVLRARGAAASAPLQETEPYHERAYPPAEIQEEKAEQQQF